MLKVLLVDDELYNRKGLAVLVDWEKEGFSIAGEASDGAQALEAVRNEHFDLVLTDIKMPVMDGFQLLEAIRELEDGKNTHFVIVSGFDDFENAKKAMQYGCVDFLSKPVNREELVGVLRAVARECEKQKRDENEQRVRDRMILERHLSSLIAGKFDEVNLNYVREHMELTGKLRYINIELDLADTDSVPSDETQRRSMQRELYNIISGFMGERSEHVIFDVSKAAGCYDVGMLYTERLASELGLSEREYIEKLVEYLKESFDCRLLIQIGSEVRSIEKISESYRSATVAKLITTFDGVAAEESRELPDEASDEEQRKVMDALIAAMEQHDTAAIDSGVDELYGLFTRPDMDYRTISQTINYMMLRLMHEGIAHNPGINQEDVMQYLASNAFDSEISRGSKSHFASFCREYSEYLSQLTTETQNLSQSGGILVQVEQEIAEHYMENISLKSMSEKYFINSAYLGQLFRKKFGKTFKEYLNEYRIKKAAELLATTNMRVYQVSEAVGYQSLDYFISKFVQIEGHTPSQYRKKYGRE